MPVVPAGWAHIAMQHRMQGDPDPWYVTYGVFNEQDATITQIGNSANAAYFETFKSGFSSAISFTGCQVTLGADEGDPLVAFVPNSNASSTGTSSAEMLPQNCALLVDKLTDLGGKKHRGRFFLPGVLQEGKVNAVGQIDNAWLAIWQGYVDLFLNVLESPAVGNGGKQIPMVILHSQEETPSLPPTLVTSLSVQPVISTQRRRLR